MVYRKKLPENWESESVLNKIVSTIIPSIDISIEKREKRTKFDDELRSKIIDLNAYIKQIYKTRLDLEEGIQSYIRRDHMSLPFGISLDGFLQYDNDWMKLYFSKKNAKVNLITNLVGEVFSYFNIHSKTGVRKFDTGPKLIIDVSHKSLINDHKGTLLRFFVNKGVEARASIFRKYLHLFWSGANVSLSELEEKVFLLINKIVFKTWFKHDELWVKPADIWTHLNRIGTPPFEGLPSAIESSIYNKTIELLSNLVLDAKFLKNSNTERFFRYYVKNKSDLYKNTEFDTVNRDCAFYIAHPPTKYTNYLLNRELVLVGWKNILPVYASYRKDIENKYNSRCYWECHRMCLDTPKAIDELSSENYSRWILFLKRRRSIIRRYLKLSEKTTKKWSFSSVNDPVFLKRVLYSKDRFMLTNTINLNLLYLGLRIPEKSYDPMGKFLRLIWSKKNKDVSAYVYDISREDIIAMQRKTFSAQFNSKFVLTCSENELRNSLESWGYGDLDSMISIVQKDILLCSKGLTRFLSKNLDINVDENLIDDFHQNKANIEKSPMLIELMRARSYDRVRFIDVALDELERNRSKNIRKQKYPNTNRFSPLLQGEEEGYET